MVNIRGNLYSVTDFSAFQGREPTPHNSVARLLLIGARHGNNASLLVTRMLGLRNREELSPAAKDPDAPPWEQGAFTDKQGRLWKYLDVRALLADDRFMDIGV